LATAISETVKGKISELLSELSVQIERKEVESKERVAKAQAKLDEDTAKFAEMRAVVDKRAKELPGNVVRLNIGGTVFAATKDTWMHNDSFFSALIGCDSWQPDASGDYFIDRDPVMFPYIMTFLRSGRWFLGGLSEDKLEMLESELDFYSIKMPCNYCVLDESKSRGMVLSNSNKTCTGSGTVLSLTPIPKIGTIQWKACIDAKSGNNWSAIGIASLASDLSSLCTDTPYGCGLYIDQNNCQFRQKGSSEADLNSVIGTAIAGKVIIVTVKRTEEATTIQFETDGNLTNEFPVTIPGKNLYVAMSPSTDCVLTLKSMEEA